MLSRGFTIEGLTITYFRRLAKAHDTLLQMGRWFGYRPGYSDLVRVYLARQRTVLEDEDCESVRRVRRNCQERECFPQAASRKYSGWVGDSPMITPREVRPLVMQSLPWLKPTAPNKMYNAKLVSQREPVFSPKGMAESPLRGECELGHNTGHRASGSGSRGSRPDHDRFTSNVRLDGNRSRTSGSECPSLFELARRLFRLCRSGQR